MVALQIRGVPDEVRDALAEQARQNGQSLQAYLLALVEAHVRRGSNPAVLSRLGKRDDGIHSTAAEIAAVIGAERERRSTPRS